MGYGKATAKNYALAVMNPNAKWHNMDDLPVKQGITHGAFVVIGKKLYMCGGYVGKFLFDFALLNCLCAHQGYALGLKQATIPDLTSRYVPYMIRQNLQLAVNGATSRNSPKAVLVAGWFTTRIAMRCFSQQVQNGHRQETLMPSTTSTHGCTVSAALEQDEWKNKTSPLPCQPHEFHHRQAMTKRHYFLAGQIGENESTGNIKDNYEWDAMNKMWIRRKSMPFTRGHTASSTRAIGGGFIIAAGLTNESGKTSHTMLSLVLPTLGRRSGIFQLDINTPVCDIDGGYFYCEGGWANGADSYRIKIEV